MQVTDEMKPCPFCGGRAHTYRGRGGYWATCTECDAESAGRPTAEKAAELWNRRAVLSKAEPVGVGVKELRALLERIVDRASGGTFVYGQSADMLKQRVEFLEKDIRDIAGAAILSLPCKENGETVTPSQDVELPADIIESLLAIGKVEWGVSLTQTDDKHASDLLDTLRITREHFGITDEETGIHGVYLEGTGTVLAHTGTSPNSPQHARILCGAWNQLVEIAKAHSAKPEADHGN